MLAKRKVMYRYSWNIRRAVNDKTINDAVGGGQRSRPGQDEEGPHVVFSVGSTSPTRVRAEVGLNVEAELKKLFNTEGNPLGQHVGS